MLFPMFRIYLSVNYFSFENINNIMEILLIRHAQSQHNIGADPSLDSNLTNPGVSQSKRLGKWLHANMELDHFIGLSSPYLRTIRTAHIISKITNIPFAIEPNIREFHMNKDQPELVEGGMEILNRNAQYKNIEWPEWKDKIFFTNETLKEFFERITLFAKSLEDKRYVIVTHGAPVRKIHDNLTNQKNESITSERIKNCSITWIKDGKTNWFARKVI